MLRLRNTCVPRIHWRPRVRVGNPLARIDMIHSSCMCQGISQSPSGIENELVFPGSVTSKFTHAMQFQNPTEHARMDTYRLIGINGEQLDDSYTIPFTKEDSIKMYREMITISILDAIMYDAQRQGRLSFYMVSAGEEGAGVGSAAALTKDDVIFSQYREQGALFHRGLSLRDMMNQLYHNKYDDGMGHNMPVHYGNAELNIHPISSPLATQIPHAAGAAYALKMDSSDRCVICYFGEGAASEGDFHAALNIAATRSCPIIFFCRNNGYAISTPSLEQYKGDGIASRGVGYGIETIRVDGNDLAAVHRVTSEARERVIHNQRPILIEAMSYRVSHHSTSDDSFAYRSKKEVEEWKKRDNPISRMRKWMELKGWWSDDLEDNARRAIRKEVLTELSRAENTSKPPVGYLFKGTYNELCGPLKEQHQELKNILNQYPDNYDLSAFEGGKDGIDRID